MCKQTPREMLTFFMCTPLAQRNTPVKYLLGDDERLNEIGRMASSTDNPNAERCESG
jgi:hypothetical protein